MLSPIEKDCEEGQGDKQLPGIFPGICGECGRRMRDSPEMAASACCSDRFSREPDANNDGVMSVSHLTASVTSPSPDKHDPQLGCFVGGRVEVCRVRFYRSRKPLDEVELASANSRSPLTTNLFSVAVQGYTATLTPKG